MKAQSGKLAHNKDSAPESEEQKFKQKCKELKKRITEIEESNEIATLALSRTKNGIRRLRLEYMILLERLEDRAIMLPDGNYEPEEMSPPPSPSILDDSLSSTNAKLTRNGLAKRGKKGKNGTTSSGATGAGRIQRVRDPDLPKRPTNAYLIFCDMEKERIKQELEEKSPGVVSDLSKTLTEAWKNLPDDDRKPYYKLYEDDRDRYQREMLIYNQKKQLEDPSQAEKRPVKRQKVDNVLPSDDIIDMALKSDGVAEFEQENDDIEPTSEVDFKAPEEEEIKEDSPKE